MEQPKVAGKVPQMEELEDGKTYAWCSCGKSDNQPWCNGAHKGSGFTPTVFIAEETKTRSMCTCKQSANGQFCDGSHKAL